MKIGRLLQHFALLFFVSTMLNAMLLFAGPGRTTYQAKIVKPDGYPLEASSVNFKFTILDPVGSCILYSETYSSVNMSSTGGLISFSLGSGVKTYPASATTFEQVFSNITPSLSCDTGDPASYTPTATDIRKIVMQFHDGSGWQTLPAMSINAVPYAMYANEAMKLNGLQASDFVQVSTVPTCAASEALRYTGASFTCVAVGNNVTSGTVISALGYTPADGVSVTALSSSLTTTNTNVSSVSSTVFSVSSTVTSLQNSVAASFAAITSSQWTTSGTNIFYNTGNIGIGTTTPVTKLDVSGGVRIGAESTTCAPALAGTLRYNASNVEYCNGTSWQAFGVSSSGLTSLNGSTSQTQTFANATGGTAPNIVTANGVHTLNIPLASTGSVTAGLLSNADYTTFTNKITSSAASIAQVLGYVPADNAASGTYTQKANNLSDLTNIATARTNLGLGTFATASSIDLGSASATGTLAIARLPAFSGDATIAAASNTIILSNSGVTAGTYTKVTVDTKGRVTSSSALASSDVTTALGYTPASASASTQWTTSGSAIYYNTGNVGIGTAAPGTALDVLGIISSRSSSTWGSGANSTFKAVDPNGLLFSLGLDAGNTKLELNTQYGTMPIVFSVGNSEKMRVHTNGNVGIGTTTPSAKLHLAAGTSSTASFKFTSGTLLTSPQSGTMEYDGTNFYVTDGTNTRRAIATGSSAGTIDNASNINSSSNITLTPTGSVVVSSTTASTNSSTGALVVKGGLGVAGDIYTSGTIVTSSNIQGVSVTATSGMISPYIYGSTASGGALTLDSTTHSTKGNILLVPNGGNVGIGTTNPSQKLSFGSEYDQIKWPTALGVAGGIVGDDGNYKALTLFHGDSVRFETGANTPGIANERMRITSTGNVGIGATSPGTELQVYKTKTGVTTISVGNSVSSTNDGASLQLLYGATEIGSYNYYWTGSQFQNRLNYYGDLAFTNQGVEKARITSTGNVGVGTTSPDEKLTVSAGKLAIINAARWDHSVAYHDGAVARYNVGGAENGLAFGVDGGATDYPAASYPEVMRLRPTGNVGIGTSNPGSRLHIATPVSGGVNNRLVSGNSNGDLIDVTGVSGDSFLDHIVSARYTATASTTLTKAVTFKIDGAPTVSGTDLTVTEKLAFWVEAGTSSFGGNVGIGTTSPAVDAPWASPALDISGSRGTAILRTTTASGIATLKFTGVASANDLHINYRDNTGTLTFDQQAGAVPSVLALTKTGNVGIGTSAPNSLLQLKSTSLTADHVYIDRVDTSPNLDFYSSYNGLGNVQSGTFAYGVRPSDNQWQIWERGYNASWTNLFAVTKEGNVGIGTSAPSAKLHVKGPINSEIDSTIGILGQISISGRNSAAATPQYTQWSLYNMKEYGGMTGLGFYEYYDANNNGILCDGGDICSNRVTIATGGNVGIGLQNPTYLLQLVSDSAAKPGTNTWTIASDMRLKDSRAPFTRGVEELLGLHTIYFKYKKDNALDLPSDKEYVGIRAQDAQKVIPESVSVDEKGFLHFTSDAVFWTAVNAIKQLYHKLLGHDAELEKHAREIASIKEENEMLKQQNADKDKKLQDIRVYLCVKDPSAPICK